MRAILLGIAQENSIHVEELAIEPDHVHMLISIPPSMSLSKATLLLKGRSSYEFRKLHPKMKLRVRDHFWSPGKFYRTVGDVDLETTREYVRAHFDVFQRKLEEFTSGTPGL
jgi:putative transposase